MMMPVMSGIILALSHTLTHSHTLSLCLSISLSLSLSLSHSDTRTHNVSLSPTPTHSRGGRHVDDDAGDERLQQKDPQVASLMAPRTGDREESGSAAEETRHTHKTVRTRIWSCI
jgi:hypothetical protein